MAGASQPPSGPIPIEDFARLPFLSDALLSPDGTRIAARVSREGREWIAIWSLSEGATQSPRMIPVAGSLSFHWAGDRRLLISVNNVLVLVTREALLPILMPSIKSYDIETGEVTALGPSAGFLQSVIFVDPEARYVLLSGQPALDEWPNVLRVDLATGETVEVQPARRGVSSWFADTDGTVRVGVDYGERRTRIYYRPNVRSELRLIESRRNQAADESVIDSVRFISNTDRGLIVTNAATGRFGIYEYDFATDTRGAPLFEHPEVDAIQGIFASDGRLEGTLYEDDRPRVRWRDPELERLQGQIDRTFPGHTNVMVNRSRDGNRILVFSSAAHDPGTYYVFDRAARQMEIFASPYDSLVGRSLAPVRPISYRSRDGLTIRGYLTLPLGRAERDLPLIVLPHGGPFARDSWSFNPEVQFLASRGYAVLQSNFRGSTGYGREFVERGYGQFGAGMIDDIDDGVDWLVQQGIADRTRTCIMGASYGGYAAIWAAMRSPQRYRCAISLAGPSDWRTMLRHDARFFVARRYARDWRRRVEGERGADLNDVSTSRHPEMLRVPVLIAHGEQDITVPVDQSRRLVRALEGAGANVESVFYPKSGHEFSDTAESVDYMRRVEAFLSRHNPAEVPTLSAVAD